MNNTFLRAEWRKLAIANFVVDADLLQELLPAKTSFDLWEGKCYVSLIGFMFLNTTVLNFRIPFHENFEEVNLRFYVKYADGDELKRGVVFIRELVPKPVIAFAANKLYHEHYRMVKMEHEWSADQPHSVEVSYSWQKQGPNTFKIVAANEPQQIIMGSKEEFISHKLWGYTRVNDHKTLQYRVDHPLWNVYPVKEYHIDVDFQNSFGQKFSFLKNKKPESVFLAEGSAVQVSFWKALE
jgi:uncharacterized protein